LDRYRLDITGLSDADAAQLARLLGVESSVAPIEQATTRTAGELVSAAFILGVLNALPALTAPITDFLSKLREQKYIKFKFSLDGGETFVEGSGTAENIETLARTMKQLQAKP